MAGIAPIDLAPLLPSEATVGLHAPSGSAPSPRVPQGATETDSFGSILSNMVGEANRADLAASRQVEALSVGATDDLHGTMISVKEAEIGIKLVGTVRNKILDAFQELWRTSV
jgi:flagellar hook-basal body complex protein FliE